MALIKVIAFAVLMTLQLHFYAKTSLKIIADVSKILEQFFKNVNKNVRKVPNVDLHLFVMYFQKHLMVLCKSV